MKKFLTLALLIPLLSSCASNTSISRDEFAAIQDFAIDKDVTATGPVQYFGPQDGTTLAAGYLITVKFNDDLDKGVIAEYLDQHKIDIKEITRKSFIDALQNNQQTSNKIDPESAYKIKLNVKIYSIISQWPAEEAHATMGYEASLISPDGNVAWKKYDYVTTFNSRIKKYDIDAFFSDPELVKKAFADAADIVSKSLVNDLSGNKS